MKRRFVLHTAMVVAVVSLLPFLYEELGTRSGEPNQPGDAQAPAAASRSNRHGLLYQEAVQVLTIQSVDACSEATPCATPTPTPAPTPTPTHAATPTPTPAKSPTPTPATGGGSTPTPTPTSSSGGGNGTGAGAGNGAAGGGPLGGGSSSTGGTSSSGSGSTGTGGSAASGGVSAGNGGGSVSTAVGGASAPGTTTQTGNGTTTTAGQAVAPIETIGRMLTAAATWSRPQVAITGGVLALLGLVWVFTRKVFSRWRRGGQARLRLITELGLVLFFAAVVLLFALSF